MASPGQELAIVAMIVCALLYLRDVWEDERCSLDARLPWAPKE
jgi:hypothetical protein